MNIKAKRVKYRRKLFIFRQRKREGDKRKLLRRHKKEIKEKNRFLIKNKIKRKGMKRDGLLQRQRPSTQYIPRSNFAERQAKYIREMINCI